MPDLMEQMYSSHQINIPPNLPFILKQYAKAAIRTQPYDLLVWSAAYFRAKANNTHPPVKERLEYPPVDTPSRLSPGFLKVLHKQLGNSEFVNPDTLYEKWHGVCLVKEGLDSMLEIGNLNTNIQWLKFLAVAAGHLCPSLSKTMVMICEILTEEPEGGSAMVPVEVFVSLYQFLAELDCGPQPPTTSAFPAADIQGLESTPSATPSSCHVKDKPPQKGLEMTGDLDSCDGLMAWDDIKPDEVPDRVCSPKASSEPGQDSEAGLEVLDQGDLTSASDVVTLYPPQSQQQSTYSIPCSSETIQTKSAPISVIHSKTDESAVSHSSLKENDDWIKIDTNKSSDDPQKEDRKSDLTESINPSSTEITEQQSTNIEIYSEIQNDVEDKIIKNQEDAFSQVKVTTSSMNESATSEPSKNDMLNLVEEIKEDDEPQHVEFELNDSLTQKETLKSEDKIYPPEESVTVQNFVDENEGSILSYSTAEIRKGVLGDKSYDQIARASSENTVKAAETVHNIDTSPGSSSKLLVSVESSKETNISLSPQSVKDVSTMKSESFIILPPEKPWKHVPGIGPVIPKAQVLAVVEYMHYWAAKQEGMVMPRNINHLLCPPLDLPASELAD